MCAGLHDMMVAASRPQPCCVNCGSSLVAAFCAGCGQRTPTARDYSMRTLFSAAIGHLTNYDGRLLSTVRKLFCRPGQLARDHFEGRRAQHLDPFSIFVLSNVLAWLIVPHTRMFGFSLKAGLRLALFRRLWGWALPARAAVAHLSVEEMSRRIDAVSASENSVAVLCLVPMLAVGIWIVMARRGHRFVQHLVFAAHFYCIHLCCALINLGFVLSPLRNALRAHPSLTWMGDLLANNWTQHLMMAPALIVYLYFALGRAYHLGRRQSAWRALVLGLWAATVARLFFDVGFALVLIWA